MFLDALVTYPVAEPLHAKLIECMVKIPLERTLTQLQLMYATKKNGFEAYVHSVALWVTLQGSA